jgi:hypothetical protein
MIDDPDHNKYLLHLTDIDGDILTVANPWADEGELMMRIDNDGTVNGFIINLPIALTLMGVLLPFIQTAKLEQMMDDFMNPKDFP